MDQHHSGRTDLHNYISVNNIRDNVDNTNVSNDIIENTDIIASIETRLSFWSMGRTNEPSSLSQI